MVGAVVAFIAVAVIAGTVLTLAFDSVAIAITPALVIAACVALAVHLTGRSKARRTPL